MSAPERGHLLTLTKGKDWSEDEPDWDFEIVCVKPSLCDGWQECLHLHEVDGVSAECGPWDAPDGAPWADEDEFTFHGAEHEWRDGYGWTVPFDGCVVAGQDLWDSVGEIARDHGPGSYKVDDDWDDEWCALTYVGDA